MSDIKSNNPHLTGGEQPFEFVFLYREFSFFGLHTHIDVWIKYIRLTSQRTRPTKSELDKNHLPNPSQ